MPITELSNALERSEKDLVFMKEAFKQAQIAYEMNEVPVGCVLVHNDKIIARGYNQVELLKDATAHAEMICLTSGSEHLGDWRLEGTTLYCTLEPCLMCAGALYAARVDRVVWAAKDLRVGANGSWIDVFSKNHPIHTIEISQGPLERESAELMQAFFEKVRNEKKSLRRDF
ncbi:MAG: tRNA-specific adenosine deaminase [Chlamydiae bacterium CG10_big_fil_rev_8_21_14_0_10_35_9]|nr:MAG: tRNA-specific adenosine deaminase [Chlamydiae bacterium CG10_big_fil_rev_8_21_14_0_10_35_9]